MEKDIRELKENVQKILMLMGIMNQRNLKSEIENLTEEREDIDANSFQETLKVPFPNLKVSPRYPNIHFLHMLFNNANFGKSDEKKILALDEKYVMESKVVNKALYKKVPIEEDAERRNSWSFWIVLPKGNEKDRSPTFADKAMVQDFKKRTYWSLLEFTGFMQWGKHQRVPYFIQHEKSKLESLSRSMNENELDVREQHERDEGNERKRKKRRKKKKKKKRCKLAEEKMLSVIYPKRVLGPLMSIVAKELLNSQKIVMMRYEEICISGGKAEDEAHEVPSQTHETKPSHSPIHFHALRKIFWHTARGLIPHKTQHW